MSAHVLVTGALFRQPEQRTSKAGKPFVTAKIRAKDGDSTQWWKVLAFSESAGAELLRLGDGDAVSAQGQLKAELYERDGETRLFRRAHVRERLASIRRREDRHARR
jgi:single-stranded DNA-binding protein